ncbi:pPIWI_RE module domain-containing protein [Dactylosporangium darangshiense]|uniref:DUF3893 domain-containing protein n=1 Tax=Dactylosporangium darangshiense TaxID=579108 RepID=A0ABP8CTJ5_9ACTN
MPTYDHMRVGAFRLTADTVMRRTYRLLRFPATWKPALRALSAAATRRTNGEPVRIAITALNSALTALVPDLLVVARKVSVEAGDEDWLYSYHPVPPRALFTVIAAWIRAHEAPQQVIDQTLTAIRADDLVWREISLDLADKDSRALAFRLLPMEAAAILTQPTAGCPYGDTLIAQFRRCPTDTGAEIMSWPPFGTDSGAPFSVTTRITAQTHPFSNDLNLYLHVGTRRWMPEFGSLSMQHGHNVFLAPTLPYLPGLSNSRHFTKAKIELARLGTRADGKPDWGARWDDKLARLLAETGCLARLPDPRQLRANPLDWLHRDGDAAALVYRTGMLKREQVSAGLSLTDRAPVLDWAEQILAPHLTLTPPLARTNAPVYTTTRTNTPDPDPVRLCTEAANLTGGRLDIELFTGEQSTQHTLDALTARLGVVMPTLAELRDAPRIVATDKLAVHLRLLALPEITADLEPDRDVTSRTQRREQAVTDRAERIQTALPAAEHPTIAIVEIGGLDTYKGPRRAMDPKFAIRHGLLRTGRLSQFLTPVVTPTRPPRTRKDGSEPADPNRQRAISAVNDLLRQLGVRAAPLPNPKPGTIARRPAILGLWVIRQNEGDVWGTTRQVPVAVFIDPTGHTIMVRTPDVEWTPLHRGLLTIGRQHVFANQRRAPQEITRFVEQAIREVVGEYPDTLLLTHAQNLRAGWSFIANTNLVMDTLGFGTGTSTPIGRFQGLRHVRIRTDVDNETPECYAVNDEQSGHSQGVWAIDGHRMFGSTGSKPVTAGNTIHGASKITPWLNRAGETKPPNPKADVWNPQFIELTVAGIQHGDDPRHWATLAHELRWAAPYVNSPTTLPWPLHLAKQIGEYLIPTEVDDADLASGDELDS